MSHFWSPVTISTPSLPRTDREGPEVRAVAVPAQGDLRGRLPRGEDNAAQVLHRGHVRQGPQAQDTEGGRKLVFRKKIHLIECNRRSILPLSVTLSHFNSFYMTNYYCFQIPGVPIMFIQNHRYSIERMPDDYGAPRWSVKYVIRNRRKCTHYEWRTVRWFPLLGSLVFKHGFNQNHFSKSHKWFT